MEIRFEESGFVLHIKISYSTQYMGNFCLLYMLIMSTYVDATLEDYLTSARTC